MLICKVVGSVWATRKEDNLTGSKLLIVQPEVIMKNERRQPVFIAVDRLGAGVGDRVIVTRGASAAYNPNKERLSIDALIVGIVDSIDLGNGDGGG